MKIREVVLLVAILPVSALAQAMDKSAIVNDRAAMAAAAERSAALQAAGKGAVLTSNGQDYQVLPGARAVENRAQNMQLTLTQVGGTKVIETKGNFVVYSSTHKPLASVDVVGGMPTYPAVLNSNTGAVGILPGTLNVKLKNMADAVAVANTHNLELTRQFAHLQTAFYRVKPGQDVVSVAAALAADARVASAEAEVIEYFKVPH